MFRWWSRRRNAQLRAPEALERLAKIEQVLQIHLHGKPQAEVNSLEGETVANLIQALDGVRSACITLGSLVILKYAVDHEPVFHVRQLSAVEMRAIERFPDLHKHPERFLDGLADAVALPPIEPPDDTAQGP